MWSYIPRHKTAIWEIKMGKTLAVFWKTDRFISVLDWESWGCRSDFLMMKIFKSRFIFEIGKSCTMNPFFEHAFLKQEQLLQKSICVGTSSHFNFTIGKFWDHYGDERRSLKRTRKITRSLVGKARKSEKWTKNGLILKMTFFWEAGFQVQSLSSIIMIRPVPEARK